MTQPNWTRQLALALALFILGTGAYWLEYKHKPAREEVEEKSKKIFDIKDEPTQSITLTHDHTKTTFTCTDLAEKHCKPGDSSKWELSEPIKIKADDSNVNALLSSLSSLTSTDTIDLKDEKPEKKATLLKDYGLDPESRKTDNRVEVLNAQGGSTILYLGATHPIGDAIFAMKATRKDSKEATETVNDNKVYLIGQFFKGNFDHEISYWKDKKLFALGAHEIVGFKLDSDLEAKLNGKSIKTKNHVVATKKDGQWLLGDHQEMTGDSEAIHSFLTSVTMLNAKNYAADHKNDAKARDFLKGSAKVLTLEVQKEKGTANQLPPPVTLTLYRKVVEKLPTKVWATVSNLDPLYEMDAGVLNRLNKTTKELRLNKLISAMDRFGAKRIEFSGKSIGEKPMILVNQDGKWKDESKPSENINDKAQAFLDKISGNRITDFVSSWDQQKEKEGLKVVISQAPPSPTPGTQPSGVPTTSRELVFWEQDGKLYARDLASNKKEAFVVDKTVQSVLPPWPTASASPSPAASPPKK